MSTKRHFSGVPFEATVGYCRAVRSGDRILVSGTLGLGPDNAAAGGPYEQAVAALERICGAIEQLGGSRSDVVRTRMFATHPRRDWQEFARAHSAYFGQHPPVTSMLGTSELLVDGCVIEIEAEADVGAGTPA